MVIKVKESFEKTTHVKNNGKSKNSFYVDKEIQDIMKKYYQKKENSICLNYVNKTDLLSPNSSLEIMHVLKYCYIKNATDGVNYTNF